MSRSDQNSLERQLQSYRGLYDLALALSIDQDLDAQLQLIVDKSRQLLPADIAYIALFDELSGGYVKHSYSGIRTESFRRMQPSPGMGLGALVAERGTGCSVTDYFSETQLDENMAAIAREEGIVSGMAVPLQVSTRTLGLLYVFSRSSTQFSRTDLESLIHSR
jgi:GAF domain-containing protein